MWPPNTVFLAPALPDAVPTRPSAAAWGLVVVAVRITGTRTDELLAGVWLPEPSPSADVHAGDVVIRLHFSSADPDNLAVADVEVEVVITHQGEWSTVDTWPSLGAVSTVSALATSLTGTTINGWHLWRRARD